MDVYAWGGGGGHAWPYAGGGGAFVKLGGLTPPDGSTLEITVGSSGGSVGPTQGATTGSTLYYTRQLAGAIGWSEFLRQYAVWDGSGNYTWKAYFPVSGFYDIELSGDDSATMFIDNTQVHETGTTAPALTTTMTVTVNGAGGGGGGHDAGTPGRAGTAGSRVTGTFDMTLGVDTLQVDIGGGGNGGYDGSGPSNNLVQYTSSVVTNTLLGPAALTASTPDSPGALTFTGWEDDGHWAVPMPWTVNYNQNNYGTVYVGTNSYLTFGGGSTGKTSLSASNPALDKIMINAADNSCQRIYYGTEGVAPNRTFRIRWEGTNIGAIDTEAYYTNPGTYTWTCPPNVNTISVVMVGGGGGASQDESGGGGGGGLAYKNNITVTPGQTYTVTVGAGGARGAYGQRGGKGGDSSAFGVIAYGGRGTGDPNPGYGGAGGGYANADGGGTGGAGGDGNRRTIADTGQNSGGGGAGGYTGNGGRGADYNSNNQTAGSGGAGGGGGNGGPGEYGGGGGGGTGLFGLGTNGAAGVSGSYGSGGGRGGSGGGAGDYNYASYYGGNGGFPGGGGGADDGPGGVGGGGAVRIVYNFAGDNRQFPSTNVGSVVRKTGGVLGSPNMIWEAVFYENNQNQFDIQIGANARSGAGVTGLYTTSGVLSTFPADRNVGLRFTRNTTGGNGGGGGSGLTYRFFDLSKRTNVFANRSYSNSLLNQLGVWESSTAAGTFDRTNTVDFPFTGYYRIAAACDDYAYIYLDGSQVMYVPGFDQVYYQTVYITAGSHSIRTLGFNTRGPGSLAVIIEKTFVGAAGGSPGPRGSSGAGGGGGGATVIRKNSTTFLAVAAGGGGGGGAGNGPPGMAPQGTGQTVDWAPGTGENKIGDGGGGGGGGGGLQGGNGGRTFGGDAGAYSGEAGTSWGGGLTGSVISAAAAGNAGLAGPGSWSSGRPGGSGSVVITYTSPTGTQIYDGGSVTRVGNQFTHTFTSSGALKVTSNTGFAFVWNRAANVSAGWRTIRINSVNSGGNAGLASRITQANSSVRIWTTRDERDPTLPGTGRSYIGSNSTFNTEGGQLTLTDSTANIWLSGRNAGYTTSAAYTYSISREFYATRANAYVFNYMVSRAGGSTVSNVSISVDGSILGTSASVSATPNSFTANLTQGFHTITISGNTGVAAATAVYAGLEIDFAPNVFSLPLYSLRTDYVTRNNMRGGRGGPSYDSDGDGDGPFAGADGGGASVVRINGMLIAIAGGGGGAGGAGDDYWHGGSQIYTGSIGGQGEGNPVTSDGAGGTGAGPNYSGGGGGGGGGLNGGAGGTANSTHWYGVNGQGGTSFVNRRVGTDWAVTAGAYSSPGGTGDVAYKSPFGYSAQPGRVVVVFQRKPHVWQKIAGVWKRFDNISYKDNSSRAQNILNLESGDNWSTSNQVQVRYHTEVSNMATPLTQAIGGAVAIFGWRNTEVTVGSAVRTLTSRRKIDLRAFRYLWYQVNRGTTANWGETPEPDEPIYLQYSTDGITWTNLDNVGTSAVSANVWTVRTPALPVAVYKNADGVFLRFYQAVTYDLGEPTRDTWAVTSIVGLANIAEASNAKKGFDIWKGVSNVWVKVQGKWQKIFTSATTSSTPTPNRYG